MNLQEVKRTERRAGLLSSIGSALLPGLMARREESRVRIAQARLQRRLLEEIQPYLFRGYPGASKTLPYSMWDPGSGSADEDTLADLQDLRARNRDLVRGDSHAAGLIDTWVQNIVGSGLIPQSRIDREEIGLTEDEALRYQKAAERVYRRWSRVVDVAGLLSAGRLQELLLRQVFENGDVFALERPQALNGNGSSLRYQMIEADRVTTPTKEITDRWIREGIVVNSSTGAHEAYWIKRTHPGDTRSQGYRTDDFVKVPRVDPQTGKRNVYHLYRILRPDQSRGVPFLAPAILLFRDLQQYFRAELIGAKVAACISLWISTPDPMGEAARAATAARSAGIGQAPSGGQQELLEPGRIYRGAPGEEPHAFSPNRPNNAFDSFVTRILRAIGCAVGAPYEVVSQDFSKTTYTSGRMALTEIRRVYRIFQAWLVEIFLQPAWERLLEEAYLLGELPAPRFYDFQEEYSAARWVGPGWAWVDPAKEVSATVDSLKNYLSTLADECAARGLDWEDVLVQRAREKGRMEELGLTPEDLEPEGPPTQGDDDHEGDGEDEDALPE